MSVFNSKTANSSQVKPVRKYLKLKIVDDNLTFRRHVNERNQLHDLIKSTIVHGQSHSVLVLGLSGTGKTTLVNSVLHDLSKDYDLVNDAIVIKLNGLLHHDSKVAIKTITAQLQLENSVEDRVFGSFADNLSFLVNCLQSADKRTRSIIFLIDHFDMFCQGEKTQTLLYNMFDVAHAGRAPICVVGTSSVLDVMDLLEKRVKSRFSHRHIYLFLNEATDGCKSSLDVFKDLFLEILSLPSNVSKQNASNESSKKLRPLNTTPSKKKTNNNRLSYDNIVETKINDVNFSVPQEILVKRKCENVLSNLDPTFIDNWNAHIEGLIQDERVVNAIEKFCYYETNEVIFRNILYEIVGKLSENKHFIHAEDVVATIDKTLAPEHRVKMLQSLSVLELSLIIAMKHGMEIFDKQPLNFEMVLHRYKKFADANSSTQNVPKGAILKAFEHLQELEIIVPVRSRDSKHSYGNTTSAVQKEYKLFTLPIPNEDIEEAVKNYKSLPTEINHWFNNSVF